MVNPPPPSSSAPSWPRRPSSLSREWVWAATWRGWWPGECQLMPERSFGFLSLFLVFWRMFWIEVQQTHRRSPLHALLVSLPDLYTSVSLCVGLGCYWVDNSELRKRQCTSLTFTNSGNASWFSPSQLYPPALLSQYSEPALLLHSVHARVPQLRPHLFTRAGQWRPTPTPPPQDAPLPAVDHWVFSRLCWRLDPPVRPTTPSKKKRCQSWPRSTTGRRGSMLGQSEEQHVNVFNTARRRFCSCSCLTNAMCCFRFMISACSCL